MTLIKKDSAYWQYDLLYLQVSMNKFKYGQGGLGEDEMVRHSPPLQSEVVYSSRNTIFDFWHGLKKIVYINNMTCYISKFLWTNLSMVKGG